MKKIKDFILNHKYVFSIVVILITMAFMWSFLASFSEDAVDSSWDGVVARNFAAGTGSSDNPYIISNASEYAFFKEVMEGVDAEFYATKNYIITAGFNYGEYDISINNTVPFSGVINGDFNIIYNATLSNSLFALIDGAVIKNINYHSLNGNYSDSIGVLANSINNSEIKAISLYGNVSSSNEDASLLNVSGLANSITESNISDMVVGIVVNELNYVSIANEISDTEIDNIFVLGDNKYTNSENIDLSSVYEIQYENDLVVIDEKTLNLVNNDEYSISISNNTIIFRKNLIEDLEDSNPIESPAKAPSRSASIALHNSGTDTASHSVYINDLDSDYNYYMGLNYTKINNSTGVIPDGTNRGLYSNSNLATVYIRYSGADINDDSIYGRVSVSENFSNFYYYKRIPVVSGSITFDLIDNPWANRPNGRAFNGWVTDYDNAVVSLDMDRYVRSVTLPVSDVSSPISITFYSSWTEATTVTSTGSLSSLKSVGMTALGPYYGDMTQYFIRATVNYYNRYPNTGTLYDLNGYSITLNSYCTNRNGCTYYRNNTSSSYDPNTTYYTVTGNNPATITVANLQGKAIEFYDNGDSAAGYFIRVNSGSDNVYSATGEKLTTCSGTCYKLLQYSDGTLDSNTTYYYLTTRDTNIFAPTSTSDINTSNISTSRPMTITGINNGTDNSNNRRIYLNDNWTISSDLRVEFIGFYVDSSSTGVSDFDTGGYKIVGNYKNVKLGRGLKRNGSYLTATSFLGGSSSSTSSLQEYTMIVESGYYQNGSGVGYGTSSWFSVNVPNHYVRGNVILGNDFDRIVTANNGNLTVYYCYAGTWGSYLYNNDDDDDSFSDPAIYTIVKSGSFGANKADYAAGVYVGGRSSGTHYAIREMLVEGGYIYNLIGGPMSADNRASKNDIVINVKGGTMDMIFGGAGVSNTVGNRILNITGGTINYSILGGSNAYDLGNNSSNPYGKITGDTLIYVGGGTKVGTVSGSLYNVKAGCVFGAGNGRSGEDDVGSVNNSNIIIDTSASISGDIYGGGNFGAIGASLSGSSTSGSSSTLDDSSGVYEDGTGANNIRYYGDNPNNYIMFNNERYRIVGLFNNVSTSSGNKNLVRIVKGTSATNSVQWSSTYISTSGNGRDYSNYFVRNDNNQTKSNIYNYLNTTYYNGLNSTYRNYIQSVNWNLGALNSANNTASAFYASERGTTPGSSYSVTNYNYNVGLLYPSDIGYASGEGDCLSRNLSNFSGSSACYNNNWIDIAFTNDTWLMTPSTTYSNIYRNNNRNYNSWNVFYFRTNHNVESVGVAYRSGNSYYYDDYAVYPSFYLKDTVTIASGDGSYDNPYVIGSSDNLLTDVVYEVMHPPIIEEPDEPEINVHDESDYMAKTHIQINGGNIAGSVYGAGNSNGAGNNNNNAVALAKITIDMSGGTVTNSIYGGANAKGTVYGDVFLNIENGYVGESVYGGGKGGYTSASLPGTYVSDNIFVTIGGTNTSNLTIHDSVYGGSAFGSVNTIDQSTDASDYAVYVKVNDGVITGSVFGGGEGNSTYTPRVVGDIDVEINGGDITSVFGGNDQAGAHNKNNSVTLNGGTIDSVYGGGNKSSVTNTNVYLMGSTVGSIYGGSNTSGTVSTTNVDINSGVVQNVYGGNNEGGTCGVTDVNVTGTATINGSVYGGGNEVNTTNAVITLNSASGTIPNVYGGGNKSSVTNVTINNNGVNVGNLFGGSNSSGVVSSATINQDGGIVGNLYGGNNAGGNTVLSNLNMISGTVGTIYGGGNQANSGTTNVLVSGGVTTDIFGGGNSAGLNESHVHITGGSINGSVYGGSNSSGTLNTTDIVVDNSPVISAIYGGGNRAPVGNTSVVINGGTIGVVYGGGNLAQATGNTTVDINSGVLITGNLYGGGNFGVVKGSSTVTITSATVLGSAYAGGNGNTATLEGDTYITVDGTSVIGSSTSVAPASGCVFGGGNQAFTGTQEDNDSTSHVNIVGGTIYGNVYGGANTSVIYGNTLVNIGQTAYTSASLIKAPIYIKGNVFGGGEANAGGSEIFDWSFISVTEGANITIDGATYNSFKIDGSFFGGGNASSASGDSYLLIRNYGSGVNPKRNISIQRVTYVTIDNSSILLSGASDRANEYDTELFSISRVEEFKLQNNAYLFLEVGANLLEDFKSLDSSGSPAVVTIDTENNTLTRTVDNRVYMYEGKNLNIATDQQVTSYGDVTGMSFLGIFNYASGTVNTGMYNSSYAPGDTLDRSGLFAKGSYVLGKHMSGHNIKLDGFYSNFMNDTTLINEVDYIDPTPKTGQFYMWYIGENVMEYNVNLVASKYSTLGSVEQSFLEFSKPNTSFQIDSFDISDIAPGISLVDKNTIPRIAANQNDANSIFGLSMEASNNGWLTTGKTSFYTASPWIDGVTYYEGENSNVVPTMLFYLYHSKNLSVAQDLGTVRISITAITKLNALSNEVKRLVVNVNMSSALFQTNEYEGAMTPGDKYDLFTSTSTNITTKSKFSTYYALYGSGTNLYGNGYHRVLTSSYILPLGTKVTMLDLSSGTPQYYYHVIDASDVSSASIEFQQEGECSYRLSLFTKMGSLNSNTNYNDATMNAIYYNGTDSSEEFVFIVDFSDTNIVNDQMSNSLLIEIRDANDESITTVLGIQHAQLVYNLYANRDSEIDIDVDIEDNPLYIGYNDVFDVVIDYQNSSLAGVSITDTQYFDSKLGVQIYILNSLGNVVSGTDLTGAYFLMDGVRYYPDIAGYTHIKLADKVGNTEKWITFNTENAGLATGSYTFKFEAFASPDGIYYSSGTPDYYQETIDIINSTYGLNPVIDDNSVIFSAENDKSFNFTLYYTSLLTNPNIRIIMYRREYDDVYDTGYELADFQDFTVNTLAATNVTNEYYIDTNPMAQKSYSLPFESQLLTGTYRLSFRLYDSETLIGEINRYIVVK